VFSSDERAFHYITRALSSLSSYSTFFSKTKNVDLQVTSPRCLCPPLQLVKQLTDFHDTWYQRYITGEKQDAILLNLLQLVTKTWQSRETVKRHERLF
jgi:hypothetical protein